MRHSLHWLDMTDCIQFWIPVTVCMKLLQNTLLNCVSLPLTNHHSALASTLLAVPSVNTSIYGGHAFSVTGPTVWNGLPEYLRDRTVSLDVLKRYLLTYFCAC